MKLRYCDGGSFSGDAKFDNGVVRSPKIFIPFVVMLVLEFKA